MNQTARLRVYPVQDVASIGRKANKAHDDYTRLMDLCRSLPDVVIKVSCRSSVLLLGT